MSLLFSNRGSFSLSVFLAQAWNGLTRLWTFIRNELERHHALYLFGFAYTAVRLGVYIVSSLFTSIYRVAVLSAQSITSANSQAGGLSFLEYFGLVNSIFPVQETFVFLGTVLTVRTALWGYVFLRTLYKNIPLKST